MMARATRYTLQLPLQYRAVGSQEWHPSETQDMSRAGGLFTAMQPLAPGAQIELRVSLGLEEDLPYPVNVLCSGEVVRREGIRVAVQIRHYEWQPARAASHV